MISLDFIGFQATARRLAAGQKMVDGEAAAAPKDDGAGKMGRRASLGDAAQGEAEDRGGWLGTARTIRRRSGEFV